MKIKKSIITLAAIISISSTSMASTYEVVDTNQNKFFNNTKEISAPSIGDSFYGQDANYTKNQPSYTDLGDDTVLDNVTGLIWQKTFKIASYNEALELLDKLNKEDSNNEWRLPSIKELYSLMDFSGVDASGKDMSKVPAGALPFINTDYFDFEYGSNGDRIIDTQLLSSNIYTGKTMNGADTVFGLNVADGRIKGYPLKMRRSDKKYTVRFVTGNEAYGINDFNNNNNGTIIDNATQLMWAKDDSKEGMNWEEALTWAAEMNDENYLGYSNWRVPNAKELHTILDYSNSPQKNGKAAIDDIFNITTITREDGKSGYASYWSSTTHEGLRGGGSAVYISFGEALGYMEDRSKSAGPARGRNKRSGPIAAIDVHGAGAQRSDPKTRDARDYPEGHGPQGDVVRINNLVRLVRDVK